MKCGVEMEVVNFRLLEALEFLNTTDIRILCVSKRMSHFMFAKLDKFSSFYF